MVLNTWRWFAVILWSFLGVAVAQDRWYWYQQAKSQLLKNLEDDRNYNVAKNLILFVGDGMGLTTVTTARILRGQQKGQTGEENELAFDKFEYVALAKTYNTDSQVGDSGACATALLCGVKGRFETVGLDDSATYDDCQSSFKSRIPCLADWAQAEGFFQSQCRKRFHFNKFTCQLCNFSTNSPGKLEKHQVIHTGARPYMCTMCSQCFSFKSNMQRHLKGFHKINLPC